MKSNETFVKKGERHFVWPRENYHNGVSTFCVNCAYYYRWEKPKFEHDGECTSKCQNTEGGKGYHHNSHGNDYTVWNNHCKWWWPKEGEQDENSLFGE